MASKSLPEAVAKGQAKLQRKSANMVTSYNTSKTRAINHYPSYFGPTRRANYATAINAATYHAPDPQRWADNYAAKMAE